MQNILDLDKNLIAEEALSASEDLFGQKIGILGKLFGCWHKSLTRPFTIGNASYRSCINCGARKQFDPQTLETFGSFHYPPAVQFENN